jgi:hypothetical protein
MAFTYIDQVHIFSFLLDYHQDVPCFAFSFLYISLSGSLWSLLRLRHSFSFSPYLTSSPPLTLTTFLILKVYLICIFPCRSLGFLFVAVWPCLFFFHTILMYLIRLLCWNLSTTWFFITLFSQLPIQSSTNESHTRLWPPADLVRSIMFFFSLFNPLGCLLLIMHYAVPAAVSTRYAW